MEHPIKMIKVYVEKCGFPKMETQKMVGVQKRHVVEKTHILYDL